MLQLLIAMVFHHLASSLRLKALKLLKAGSLILCGCGQVKSLFALTQSLWGVGKGEDFEAIKKFKLYSEEGAACMLCSP